MGVTGPLCPGSFRAGVSSGSEDSGGTALLVPGLQEEGVGASRMPNSQLSRKPQTSPKQENKQPPGCLINSEFQINNK